MVDRHRARAVEPARRSSLSIVLAFVFGYGLTSLPLLRAGLALAAVVPIALASDTLSIATMEIVDNAIVVAVPGALDAGLGDLLFWGSLTFSLAVAGAVALPVNRWLIARGKGHAAVHETGIHGGPSPRLVGVRGGGRLRLRRRGAARRGALAPGRRAPARRQGTGRPRRNLVTLVAMTETSEASYYVTGPRYGRVLLALAVPCAVAVLAVGVACGLLRFSTATAVGFALILVVVARRPGGGPDPRRRRRARRPPRRAARARGPAPAAARARPPPRAQARA